MEIKEGCLYIYDEALFYWKILSTHVDDFLYGWSKKFQDEIIAKIKKTFVTEQF